MKLLRLTTFALLITSTYYLTTNSQSNELSNQQNIFSAKEYNEAITLYKKAIAVDPTNADLFFNLGQALYATKKYTEALDAYKKTIRLKNDHYLAYTQIGHLLIDANQLNDAIIPLTIALTFEQNNPKARLLLAQIYKQKTEFNKAIEILTEGLVLEPNHPELLISLAHSYDLINKFDEAFTLYEKLNQQVPNNPTILYNMAYTLKKMEKLDEAVQFYNKVLEINPHHMAALFGRCLAYLMMGDFEKGWADYEHRYRPPHSKLFQLNDTPEWDGSDLDGKIILIHNAEQSFGDTFQFIRYAKLIKEKNGIVIAAVQKALIPIIKLCPYIDDVVSKDEAPPYCDVHARIMSLPYLLQTRLTNVPNECPYLYADEKLTAHWKKELSQDNNFKIGICWQASDPQRSVPLEQLIPLCTVPNTTIYSLQKIAGTNQLENLPNTVKIITFDGDFDQSNGSFMDTAAVIKNLDLIITVDTSIGHLAGGLGVNTWIIRPNPADWRWIINQTDTPWYPTVRLFKQPTPGDWTTMIQEVAQELKNHIAKK